ncbi:hypothetical protein P691DRAFT_805193 [Macrolepiota fuliginosa MF-IS2]|uniref:Conserved oligomeric Golgi complex subunit 3 n=1 Tax=Macrolepiota fuliginosa MF-IS2 TaxID=1400762 RepID=A0A9P5X9I5_9AGAR|nr:hypothetical protein P691DRAFT_805193 [Macrolepiota fuliginosa MF-IS2]
MASSRPSQPRRPPAITPAPKTISVEEWEAKAPLGDLELRSINALKAANEKIPLPLRFTTQEDEGPSHSRPGTPLAHARLPVSTPLGSSRPGTPSNVTSRTSQVHALHPKSPVQSPEQFYDWFTLIDRSVAHSQEAHFRAHVASLMEHLEVCEGLIKRIGEVDNMLGEMYEEWWRVEENGRVVKEGCERVVEERDRLLEATANIGEHLEYFQELEKATRMLNHPGESLIFEAEFLYMVERVDVCISFLKAHRHYREAEVYLLRFQQCMTRAMTLIKMSFVGSLRALTADISRRLSEKDVSQTAQHHLLYTRFLSVAPKIHPLLRELERRAAVYPEDLSSLLSECYNAYFSARRSLLAGWIQEEIKALDVVRGELVELTRAGCSFLKQLCTDEFNLYRAFFSTAEEELYQYLEKLCDVLYDDLRPRILHEPRLTALCEVCTVLQALMVLDSSTFTTSPTSSPADSDASDDDDVLTVDLDSGQQQREKGKSKGRLHTSRLLQMVLQDAQTRLFFKAQAMIQSDVRYYVPKPEDLKWPELLIGAYKSKSGGKTQFDISEKASVSQVALGGLPKGSLLRERESWYPTVRKMVWVLEQLRDFVQPAIFEDIAQEAIQLCHQSLITASENIKAHKGSAGMLDGELFLLRHLLILKEVIVDFELGGGGSGIAGSSTDMGLIGGGVTDTLANLLSRTSGLLTLPEGLFGSLGVGVHGERGDLQYNIDQALRKTCENIIFECTNIVCRVISPWLSSSTVSTMASSLNPATTSPPAPGPSTSAGSRPSPKQVDALFRESCTRDLHNVLAKMKLYLDSEDAGVGVVGGGTVGVLVHHVRERIMEGYREFLDAVESENVRDEGQAEGGDGDGLMGVIKLGEVLSRVIDGVDTGRQSVE